SRIVVRSDVEEYWENARLPKDLTIEAEVPAGAYISWRLPPTANPKAVLQLCDVEGLRIKGFSFDGQNRAENGLYLYSSCPGVTFEDIRVVNCKQSAIMLTNATGAKDRPITFSRVRAGGTPMSKAVIYLYAISNYSPPANENIVIQDCVLDGANKTVLRIHGSVQDFTFQHNRLFQAQNAVIIEKPENKNYFQMKLHANTFFDVKGSAFSLEAPWLAKTIDGTETQVAITQNLFVQCAAIMSAPELKPLPSLVLKGNARSKDSAEGNASINATPTDVILSSSDPNSDQFLRYPKESPPFKLPGGPAGVPPQ
ncbi:MAG TPA: hypothetical protein VGZ47_21305, partial [Gemmataceae bacterium]|nr:hypothetical protein [Gemmataceae bacterium]